MERLPKEFTKYVEPFCGSAALFFHGIEKRAALNDINSRLINFYRHCQSNPAAIIAAASSMERNPNSYYRYRSEFNVMDHDEKSASYFYYLNRNCFNGLYRTDKKGNFNVPFSASRTGRLHAQEEFLTVSEKLKDATFSSVDFEEFIAEHIEHGAFFFVDPPYAISRRAPFTEYYANAFTTRDLDRLLKSLEAIDDAGATFLLTFDGASEFNFCARETWIRSTVEVRRNIAGFGGARKNATEAMITNYRW